MFMLSQPANVDWELCNLEPFSPVYRQCTDIFVGSEMCSLSFYSETALLAMQSAVLATAYLSVCLSVCLSITFRCFVQMNEDTIIRISVSGSTMTLVSEQVKFIRTFAGIPRRSVKVKHPLSLAKTWPIISHDKSVVHHYLLHCVDYLCEWFIIQLCSMARNWKISYYQAFVCE